MIKTSDNSFTLEPSDSLEPLMGAIGCDRLYLDFETTSFDRFTKGLHPYRGHKACGYAVTWDDHPNAYYVPMRHTIASTNFALDPSVRFMKDAIRKCRSWVNPNVKFDAHVALQDGAEFQCRLVDLIVGAKLIDSDRMTRGGYGLDVLSRDLLGRVIKFKEDEIQKYLALYKKGNKVAQDYALVPADRMGDYACEDVLTGRGLDHYIATHMPEFSQDIWETEQLLTPVLFDIERTGMRIDPELTEALQYRLMTELALIEERIQRETGLNIQPHNTGDCYELLCGHYGLPVLEFTEKGNPSFDFEAMLKYSVHPAVVTSPKRHSVVKLMMYYRDRYTLLHTFVSPYLQLHVDGILHPEYNQCIRTGRMSCKEPNAQQLSHDAKELIIPDPGMGFLSCDLSQIEFRILVHYIDDVKAVTAYNENPDTDFHSFVAKECDIPRKPAKNVNFCMGYGGGKKRCVQTLVQIPDVVSSVMEDVKVRLADPEQRDHIERTYRSRNNLPLEAQIDESALQRDMYENLCWKKGEHIYDVYHEKFPGIKVESNVAGTVCRDRGWVRTFDGRKRILPTKAAWRAFNSVCQGSAADIMKYMTVKLAPRYNKTVRDIGITLTAQVHDENLFQGPKDVTRDPRVVKTLVEMMETPRKPLKVPIRASAGWSDKNWAIASGDEGKISVDRSVEVLA